MTKRFRFMTGLLAAALAFVVLSSAAYIAAESHHDCTGVDCAICHQISACEDLLRGMGLVGAAVGAAAAVGYVLCRVVRLCGEASRAFTLVSLKVKLSD